MEVVLIVFLLAALVGGVATWPRGEGEPPPSPWQELAESCGLSDLQRVTSNSRELVGRFEGLEVEFGAHLPSKGQGSTRLTIRGISQFIAFQREGLVTRFDRVFGGGEVTIGDRAFDRALYLQGDERLFRALLDSATRQLLLNAFAGAIVTEGARAEVEVTLSNGWIQAVFADRLGTDPLPRPDSVRWLIHLARRLREPHDVTARIASNAQKDPLPEVRRLALRTLERTAPEDAATRAAMQHAARSETNLEVRVYAALQLGRDGWPTLEELAQDSTLEDSLCARAIGGLGEHMALDRASRVLEESMADGRPLTARAAAKVLGWGGEAEVPILVSVMQQKPELAAAAAASLGQIGSPSAEVPLIATLRIPSPDLRAAAAAALGRLGSAAAVEPLRELARVAWGMPRNQALAAIVRIQTRLTGADPGQLSMVEGADGQLALADDERGRVTLPDSNTKGES